MYVLNFCYELFLSMYMYLLDIEVLNSYFPIHKFSFYNLVKKNYKY